MPGPASTRRGFTIVELLVVVGVIALIVGILVPALSGVRRSSRKLACQSNMRQITVGLLLFPIDYNERYISSNTELRFQGGGGVGTVDCKAWVNAKPGNLEPDPTGPSGTLREKPEALMEGFAASYIGDGGTEIGGVYRSPLDPTERLRSYSLNGCVGHEADVGFLEVLDALDIRQPPLRTTAQAHKAHETLYVIPEDMRGASAYNGNGGWNLHGWILDFFQPKFNDVPAYWAGDGINLSFLDGHVAYRTWSDPEFTKNVVRNHDVYAGPDYDFLRYGLMPDLGHHIGADD